MTDSLTHYRIDPPAGEEPSPCERHPAHERVYVEIPVLDLTNSERPAVVRGWTCPGCWRGRSFRVDLTEARS